MGKKTVQCLLIMAMIISLCCLPSLLATAAEEGDWQYTLYDDDTTATITGYTGADTDITIPSTIAGYPVTRIGSNAFLDKTTINSVTIPDSVLRIESAAFQNSTLTAVDLGEGVTYIGQHAFYSTELTTLTIPTSLATIDNYAFADCTSLATITIDGNNLTALGEGAFNNTAISEFTIPTSLAVINKDTFANCTNLTAVTIPSGITEIGYYAFGGCSQLVSATFAGDAPTMGNYVFNGAHAGFIIYYYSGAPGFTTPTWTTGLETYNTVALSVPQLTAGDVVRNCDFTARVKFTSDTAGRYYYQLVTNGDTEPDVDTSGTGVSCDTTEQTIYLDDLGAGDWDIYIVVKDGDGNCSEPLQLDIDSLYWGDDISVTGQYPFAGGDGSADDPYLIATPQQLAQLAWDVAKGNGYNDDYFQLTDDIDLAGHYWRPIGISATEEFMGYFDGDNRLVSNMTIGTVDVPAMGEYMGLFGYLQGAVIHNVIVADAALYIVLEHDDYDYDDCFAGMVAGQCNSTDIRFCQVTGTINVSSPDDGYIGGLVGNMDYYCDGVIGCNADVDIAFGGYQYAEVGGLIGESSAPVIGCSASGDVSGIGYLGGLIGDNGGNVSDSYATGDVHSSYMAGGLLAYNSSSIINCYATGTVYGQEYAGGLVCFTYGSIKNSYATGAVSAYWYTRTAGGLVGYCSNGGIQNSYAAGQVSYTNGPVSQGLGLVGDLYDATVTDSYWNSDLNPSGGGGTGKTTAEMQSQDFADLLNNAEATGRDDSWRAWQIIDAVNSGMPVLSGVGMGMSNAPAVITNANGIHNLAADGEISFDSDCLGEYYYDIVAPGDTPSFDTTGSGFLCYKGTTTATLPASSGAWDIYITVKNLSGAVSDPVKIELAAEPALFAGGSGTANDPYQIATPYHLYNIRYYLDDCFVLNADIDLDPALLADAFWYDTDSGWIPIADTYPAVFTGVLDGNGKTVANMSIGSASTPQNAYYNLGLFGYVGESAEIFDLGITEFEIYSSGNAGGIAGDFSGSVDHCYLVGSISIGIGNAGGLAANNNLSGTITNSWADVAINATDWVAAGGMVGYNNGQISNCCSTGNVEVGSWIRAGGFVGINHGQIRNSYATGDVSGSAWGYVGAFYGENDVVTNFTDCYWNADAVITATSLGGDTPTVHGSSAECQSMSSAAMKTTAFVDTLNAGLPATTGYYGWEIASGVNQGYPVLQSEPAGDLETPAIADSIITASNVTKTGVTLVWEQATDNVSDSQDLLYCVYVSDADNLDTVDDIEANGTALTDFSAIDTYAVTGLSAGTTYYFNVVVKDEAGNKTAYTTKSVTTTAATSGGGSSSPPPATVIVTTEQSGNSTTNSTGITASTSSGTAAAAVSEDVVDALLAQAEQSGGTGNDDILELAIDGADDIDELQVTMAQSDLAKIADDSDAKLNISAPFISITFDGTALQTIAAADKGGMVTISAGVIDQNALSADDLAIVGDRPVYDLTVTNGDTQVSDFGGGYAMVSIPYTLLPGEDPDSVVIYYLADDGSLQAIRGCYDVASKAVIFKTAHFSQFIIGYNQVTFSDVLAGAWYKDAVDFIAARGITSGTSADRFSPDDNLTRGQFIVLLMNAYQLSPDQYPQYAALEPFADSGNAYYTQYLLAAKGLGIVNGVGNNMYAPEREISRQEMMVMLYNVLAVIDELPAAGSGRQLADYSDGDQVAEWAEAAVTALVGGEVISGYNGMINPQASTTRAEIAQVLYNLLAN